MVRCKRSSALITSKAVLITRHFNTQSILAFVNDLVNLLHLNSAVWPKQALHTSGWVPRLAWLSLSHTQSLISIAKFQLKFQLQRRQEEEDGREGDRVAVFSPHRHSWWEVGGACADGGSGYGIAVVCLCLRLDHGDLRVEQ